MNDDFIFPEDQELPREEINDDNQNNGEKISAIFILIISIILIGMDFLSLYYSYRYLTFTSKRYSYLVFDKCIKYQSITEMFFTFFALLAAMSAALMALGITIGYDLFFEKFLLTFINYNYYVFGLLLLASSIIGLLNYNKICYDCIGKNPNTHEFNLSTMICLILIYRIIYIFNYILKLKIIYNFIHFFHDYYYFVFHYSWLKHISKMFFLKDNFRFY